LQTHNNKLVISEYRKSINIHYAYNYADFEDE